MVDHPPILARQPAVMHKKMLRQGVATDLAPMR